MLIALICSFISCLLFQLSVRTVFFISTTSINCCFYRYFINCWIFSGASSPLLYECLAEMMHPLAESLPASIFVELFNVVSLIFLAIAPNRSNLMNLLVLLMMAIVIFMVICAQITSKRKDEEQRGEKLLNNFQEQLINM